MNPVEAKELVISLKRQISKKERSADHAADPAYFQNKVMELFILTLFTGRIVSKSTWKGGFAAWLSPDSLQFNQRLQVKEAFAEALDCLWKDNEANKLFKKKFYRDVMAEFRNAKLLEKLDNVESSCAALESDFVVLESIKDEKVRKKRLERLKNSFFHEAVNKFSTIFDYTKFRLSVFESFFEDSKEARVKSRPSFTEFLNKRKEFAGSKDILERVVAIDEALKFDATLQKSMVGLLQPRPKEERLKEIKDQSVAIAKQVQGLKPGERKIVAGSFGVLINTTEIFLRQLRKLPKMVTDKIPQPIVDNVINKNFILPDPKKFVESTLTPYFEKLTDGIPGFKDPLSPAAEQFLNIFLHDPKKQLPEGVANRLPTAVSEELNALLRNGLFGCMVDFQDVGMQRQLLEWICHNSDALKDPNKRQDIAENIEKGIKAYCESYVGDPKGILDSSITTLLGGFLNLVPQEFLTITGMDGHLSSGQVWLELERQNNGCFTVLVYGTGNALKHHFPNAGEVVWPLRIENVTYSKLNSGFFERFFYHHIEPTYDENAVSQASDLYKGLFAYLQINDYDMENKNKGQLGKVDSTVQSPEAMAEQLLINNKYSLDLVRFEFRLQAFYDFCCPRIIESGMTIADDAEAEALRKACLRLEQDMTAFSRDIAEDRAKEIKATVMEVKEAVFAYYEAKKPKNNLSEQEHELPDGLYEPLKAITYALGITPQYLASVKNGLCWMFGDEVEPLLRYLIRVLPPAGAYDPMDSSLFFLKDDSKVWSQKSKLINFFAHAYIKMAFTALKLLVSLISLYLKGTSLLVLIPGVQYILESCLPARYLLWYQSVMSKAKTLIFHTMLRLMVAPFFSKESFIGLQNGYSKYLDLIKRAGNLLEGNDLISFEVSPLEEYKNRSIDLTFSKEAVVQLQSSLESGLISEREVDLKIPLEPINLEPTKVHHYLADLLKNVKKENITQYQYIYLLTHLMHLPIPERNVKGIWDEVTAVVTTMEQFHDIANRLLSYSSQDHKFNAELAVVQYKLYAIMHKLAQRDMQDQFPAGTLDISPLLLWLHANPKIEDPVVWKDLKAVVSYFDPDIDLMKLPPKKTIVKAAKTRFFNYNKGGRWFHEPFKASLEMGKGVRYLSSKVTNTVTRAVGRLFKGFSIFGNSKDYWKLKLTDFKKIPLEKGFEQIYNWKHKPSYFYSFKMLTTLSRLDVGDRIGKTDKEELITLQNQVQELSRECDRLNLAEVAYLNNGEHPGISGSVYFALFALAKCKLLLLQYRLEEMITGEKAKESVDLSFIFQMLLKEDELLSHPELWFELEIAITELVKYFMDPVGLTFLLSEEWGDRLIFVKGLLNGTDLTYAKLRKRVTVVEVDSAQLASSPEFDYLKAMLKKQEVIDYLASKGLKEELDDLYKIGSLFNETFHIDSPVIPKAYALLHLQALRCQSFNETRGDLSAKDATCTSQVNKGWLDSIQRFVEKRVGETNLLMPTPYAPLFTKDFEKSDLRSVLTNNDCLKFNVPPREQLDIMKKPLIDKFSNDEDKASCEYILSKPEDRIVRALSYYKQNINKLADSHCQLLEYVLFEPGKLEQQFKDSPEVLTAIQEFLDEAFRYFLSEQCFDNLVWVFILAAKLRKHTRNLDKSGVLTFPNLLDWGRQSSQYLETKCRKTKTLLAGLSLEDNPLHHSLIEQQQGAIALCVLANTHIFGIQLSRASTSIYEEQILTVKRKFGQWLPLIKKLLKDPSFRQQLILEVLNARKVVLIPENYVEWQRTGEWSYKCKDVEVGLFKGLSLSDGRQVITKDSFNLSSEFCNAIPMNQRYSLVAEDVGHWKTSNGKYEIKINKVPNDAQKLVLKSNNQTTTYTKLQKCPELVERTKTPLGDENQYEYWLSDDDHTIWFTNKEHSDNGGFIHLKNDTAKGRDYYYVHSVFFKHKLSVCCRGFIRFKYDKSKIAAYFKGLPIYIIDNTPDITAVLNELDDIIKLRGFELGKSVAYFEPSSKKVILKDSRKKGSRIIFEFSNDSDVMGPDYYLEKNWYKGRCSIPAFDHIDNIKAPLSGLTITQNEDGRSYTYHDKKSLPQDIVEAAQEAGLTLPENLLRYWSCTSDGFTYIKIEYAHKWDIKAFTIKFKKADDSQKHHFFSVIEDEEEKIPLKLEYTRHFLHGLCKFCRLEEIQSWKRPEDSHLREIVFKPYDLKFSIQNKNGRYAASNEARFPGYAIAENQAHSAVRGISSYLLLESESKAQKVLVPDGQWVSSTAWRMLQKVGPFANYATEYLKFLDQSFMDKVRETLQLQKDNSKGYYEYDILSSGQLVSEDPKAMAYLVMLHLMQGKTEAAQKACEHLEKLAKIKPFSQDVFQMMTPLALIPFEFENIRFTRMKLFSLLEENRLLHKLSSNDRENKDSDWLGIAGSLLRGASVFMDLDHHIRNPSVEQKLTPAQEWFLFRIAFNAFGAILQGGIKTFSTDSNKQNEYLETLKAYGMDQVIEACALPGHLALRYRELKKKFELSDSKYLSAIGTGKKIMQQPSLLPQNFSVNGLLQTISGKTANVSDKFISQNFSQGNSTLQSLLEFGRFSWMNRLLDWKMLEPEKIIKDMNASLTDPPLDPQEMTSQTIIKHFSSYYSIARGESSHLPNHAESQRKFKEMLCLVKGGWDAPSRILIQYLEIVHSFPSIFPKSKKLILALDQKKFEGFFKTLANRALVVKASQEGYQFAAKALIQMGISGRIYNAIFSRVHYLSNNWIAPLVEQTLHFAGKGINFLKTQWSKTVDEPERFQASAPSQDILKEIDHSVDGHLDAAFSQIFDVTEPPASWHEESFKPFTINLEMDLASQERFKRVNTSLQDYYKRTDRVPKRLYFHKAESLWTAYVSLMNFKNSFQKHVEDDKTKLLDYLNGQITNGTTITNEMLQLMILKNDYSSLQDACQLTLAEAEQLAKIAIHCMARETRLQQLERICGQLEAISDLLDDGQFEKIEDKLQEVADELQARRAYLNSERELSTRLLMRYLMFELKTNRMIWSRQVECLEKLLPPENTNAVIELIMGLGKTSTVIPLLDAYEADGSKVVFNIYPEPIAATNIRNHSDQAKAIFDQIIYGLLFSRSISLSHEDVEAISVAFRSTLNSGITAMTKEDAQALELMMIDNIFRAAQMLRKQQKQVEPLVEAFRSVLRIMRKGKAIADEAQDVFDCYQELNYPVGKKSVIKNSYFQVIEQAIRVASRDIRLQILIQQNNLPRLNLKTFLDSITLKVAKVMLDFPVYEGHKLNDVQKEEFLKYTTGKLDYIPDWILSSANFSEIAMLKGVLTILLPNAFPRLVSVNYDAATDKKKGEYARPSDGNNNVKDEACIRTPYEAIVKTYIMLYCKGMDFDQCQILIDALKAKAQKIAKTKGIPLHETLVYQKFNNITSFNLFDAKTSYTEEQIKEIVNVFGKHPDAVQMYIRYFVYQQIPYWKWNLRSNSANFASQFGSIVSDTGTPYNDGTYPDRCKMLWDPGTIGEALHIIKQKCPENGIHVLAKDTPEEILTEVLGEFFTENSDFTAIIDGGALFKGLSNEYVARKMLENARLHMPHIKAVKFFRKNAQGRDELVWIELGATAPTLIDDSRIPPEKCLSYYDHPHGFAADIRQKFNGIGLELVGEVARDQTLQRYLQDAFRMRGLKKKKTVFCGTDETEKTQGIHFAMTRVAKNKISGDKDPILEDIVKFGIANEAARAKEDNYVSQLQKIGDVTRRAILDKILFASSFKEVIQLYQEFEYQIFSLLEDDPKKLYGYIEVMTPYQNALQVAADKALMPILRSGKFNQQEKVEIQAKLEKLSKPDPSTMPEKVKVFTDGKKLHINTQEDLNKQTQIQQVLDANSETENEQENELDQDNQQEQNLTTTMQSKGSNYTESPWPEKLDFLSTDWWKPSELNVLRNKSFWDKLKSDVSNKILSIPHFTIQTLLKESADKSLRDVSHAFDSRIWCTNNFIHALTSPLSDPVDVGSKKQLHLFEMLVHAKEDENGNYQIERVGLLSQKEAQQWRKYFDKLTPEDNKSSTKVFLYDVNTRIPVAGQSVNLEKLRKNKELQQLETQALFLDGAVTYKSSHSQYLRRWFQINGVHEMKEAFTKIYQQRGKESYLGSSISILFDDLLDIPWYNQI